jgi:hypothetical protein
MAVVAVPLLLRVLASRARLEVISKESEGTRVLITIPLEEETAEK